jgi:transmembrane sensor
MRFGPISSLRNAESGLAAPVATGDNLPLAQFIERLSAYRHGYLGCDPAVSALTVSGTFPLHDTDMALDMLTRALPVQLNAASRSGG